MSRINYSDDENYPGQFELWQANCQRSLKGKRGQAALRELEAALLALPHKRLIARAVAANGDVCAVGAVLLLRKTKEVGSLDAAQQALEADMGEVDEQGFIETEDLGVEVGMPRLVAWKIVEMNDIQCDTVWEVAYGPERRGFGTYKGGLPLVRDMRPEERYEKVLAWVRGQLTAQNGQ